MGRCKKNGVTVAEGATFLGEALKPLQLSVLQLKIIAPNTAQIAPK